MVRKKKKNRGGGGVPAVFAALIAAILFLLAKISFAANALNEPPPNTAVTGTARAQALAYTQTPEKPAEAVNILILVNKDNGLPEDYKVELVHVENGQVAEALYNDLNEMRGAAAAENIVLYIRSAYRTHEDQESTFNETVSGYMGQGNSESAAVERAELVAARPGYSEHQTGLAIDFSYGADAEKQAAMWDWLSANAYKYGFILRYPEGREHITGYSYEPWHYRYVGREHAKAIYDKNLLLEEYISSK